MRGGAEVGRAYPHKSAISVHDLLLQFRLQRQLISPDSWRSAHLYHLPLSLLKVCKTWTLKFADHIALSAILPATGVVRRSCAATPTLRLPVADVRPAIRSAPLRGCIGRRRCQSLYLTSPNQCLQRFSQLLLLLLQLQPTCFHTRSPTGLPLSRPFKH